MRKKKEEQKKKKGKIIARCGQYKQNGAKKIIPHFDCLGNV
jgi:hypothetical protein